MCPRVSRPGKLLRRIALIVVAVQVMAQLHLLVVRRYDVDEFWHVHVGYLIGQGAVPYRDFFEHHGPVAYLVAAPLARWLGADILLLTVNRLLSFGFCMVTLAATFQLAARVYGRRAAYLSILWLSTMPWYVDKSVEWRPDAPAMCFLTLAAWLLLRRGRPVPRWFVAGLFVSLSLLCTPKGVFLVAGLIMGATIATVARGQSLWQSWAGGALGAVLPWLGCGLWLYSVNALEDFYRCYVVVQAGKLVQMFLYVHLLGPLGGAPLHISLGCIGMVAGLRHLVCRRSRVRGEPALVLAWVAHLAAIPAVPVVFLQYYVIGLPLLGVLTAGTMVACFGGSRRRLGRGGRRNYGAIPLLICSAFFLVSVLLWWTSLVPARFALADHLAAALWVFAACLALRRRTLGLSLVWAALVVPGVARIAEFHWFAPNRDQIAEIREVALLAPPDQPVLTGSSGLGCLRPNASYWWCVWSSMVPLVAGDRAPLQTAVQARVPAVIAVDEDLRAIVPILEPALSWHYRPVRQQRIPHVTLLLRNDLPDPTEESAGGGRIGDGGI